MPHALDLTPMSHTTRASLLQRLHDDRDVDAWDEFYSRYWALVYDFALRRTRSRHLAEDVLQESMVRLMQLLPTFEYDRAKGQFRSYLLTVVRNTVAAAVRREARYTHLHDEELNDWHGGLPVEDSTEWGQEWDRLWRQNLLRTALAAVRCRVAPATYESFRLYVLEAVPAAAVAEQLGIERNAVFQHRARLLSMLEQEVARLQEELGEA
jgi:RNA polymerase sigma-70 factor (ECF subfamily)